MTDENTPTDEPEVDAAEVEEEIDEPQGVDEFFNLGPEEQKRQLVAWQQQQAATARKLAEAEARADREGQAAKKAREKKAALKSASTTDPDALDDKAQLAEARLARANKTLLQAEITSHLVSKGFTPDKATKHARYAIDDAGDDIGVDDDGETYGTADAAAAYAKANPEFVVARKTSGRTPLGNGGGNTSRGVAKEETMTPSEREARYLHGLLNGQRVG